MSVPSAPHIVLLAAHLAAKADIPALSYLASLHDQILRKELLLRIILTYLPETVRSAEYVDLVAQIESGQYPSPDDPDRSSVEFDAPHIEGLSDEQAVKKAKKLQLLKLSWEDAPAEIDPEDHLSLFLLRRAYRVDEEAGLLNEIPWLFAPFMDHSPYLRTWFISVLTPLLRRNCEYYLGDPVPHTLAEFERLPDRVAARLLLSQTGVSKDDQQYASVGRDLRGLVSPWLYNDSRWTSRQHGLIPKGDQEQLAKPDELCPGWEEVLQWIVSQASGSWKVAVSAIEQWDGPGDADLGAYEGTAWLEEEEQQYMERRYARAALASAYVVPEASVDALEGVHGIVEKIMSLLDEDPAPPLPTAASLLSPMPKDLLESCRDGIMAPKNAEHLRGDLLDEANPLTKPASAPVQLLYATCLSAYILTRAGSPCTIKRAADLCLMQNERDQKAEAMKLIHAVCGGNALKSDDKYWIRARNEISWLRDWGAEEYGAPSSVDGCGVFGRVNREFLEIEILKGLLNNTRYSLARSLYEDSPDAPIPQKALQDTIFAAAMNAYDNASNPNRTRGGLKKCNDIINAFPKTIKMSTPAAQRLEALLKATHSLSDYRLVLKQGEPFTPVVMRVHPDPISIIARVLEQNPKSYTNIQGLIDLGNHMVEAGLTVRDQHGQSILTPELKPIERSMAEKRITAMCVDAALTEDDFETAYSYVVNRLASIASPAAGKDAIVDEWSWKAALQAGKYRRTAKTLRPTHIGNTSSNPEIRHLEQRIECLSTALRIAPASTLQEILNTFRRCEEELDVAVRAEAESENAWDDKGDLTTMPGGYSATAASNTTTRSQPTSFSSAARSNQTEESPLSLFDLSRATARAASRNFSALSSLKRSGQQAARSSTDHNDSSLASSIGSLHDGTADSADHPRARKRDQLREAALGSLVSGVGWLVGAPPVDRGQGADKG
ncbi:hypothetical protein PpBr36_02420 [Pyricularia pennisetigena]|uniref:hypothetical protein n=1 Tax=Pyricularia pennisetigena TaxID=1578925 RepID=UPI001152B8CA|nr:hypothetical protein PpBr36_02420 [Pyricularia pennisetigena]TLS30332.1 hypothetical protein PpBr36_02420 [Pyricularia pennisetigena]